MFAIFFLTSKIHDKNVKSETMAYNETSQLNINDLEEFKDNEVPEESIKKVEEFEEKPNPNLVETNVVTLEFIGDTRNPSKHPYDKGEQEILYQVSHKE